MSTTKCKVRWRRGSSHEGMGWGAQSAQTPLDMCQGNWQSKRTLSFASAPEAEHMASQGLIHGRHPSSLLQPLSSLENNRRLAGYFKLSAAFHKRPLETYTFIISPFQVAWVQRGNFIRNNNQRIYSSLFCFAIWEQKPPPNNLQKTFVECPLCGRLSGAVGTL